MIKKLRVFLILMTNAMLLGLILLVYLDGRNPYMLFLTSGPSKIYLLILCGLGLLTTFLSLADVRRNS